ncbi:membrane protein insertion efficiency factor YidD [Patescibacteria group bacterium]|nr:membrane protein insertion efficiency factor YidD [Patescibacteria group bacterium]
MKYIFLILIIFYQKLISPLLKIILGQGQFCRFTPTCSEYTRISIQEKGIFKGGYYSMIRLLSCQPFYRNI